MVFGSPNSDVSQDVRFISTGSKRLDQLIGKYGKGFEYREDSPISILIKGKPGVGKSTLSVQMADSYISGSVGSNESVVCVYYSLDEDPNSVKARVQSLFGRPSLPYLIETIEDIKQNIGIETIKDIKQMDQDRVAELKQGIQQVSMVIGTLGYYKDYGLVTESEASFQSFMDRVELINAWLEFFANKGTNLVIIDSLNALRGHILPRQLLSILLSVIKLDGYNSIFVLEEERDSQIEEYLVDVVIELGFSSEDDPIPRFLKICKARDHDIAPVENDMVIDQEGVRIYPNIRSLLKAPHSDSIPKTCDEVSNCLFGIHGLDEQLRPPLVPGGGEKGIKRGTTTLLIGHEGTGKSYLSLYFLKEGIESNREQVLYINAGPIRSSVRDVVSSVSGLADIKLEGLPDRSMKPSEFIDRVYQVIFAENRGISRVAIDDLSVLLLSYSQDELREIIRTLAGIFKRANTSAIITYSTSDVSGHSDFNMIVDNIITTSRIEQQEGLEKPYIGICVRRLGGATVQPRLQELRYDPDRRELSVYSGIFEDLIELPDGQVSLGKLKIHYYSGETPALRDFGREFEASISGTFLGRNEEKPVFEYFGEETKGVEDRRIRLAFSRNALLRGLLFHPSFSGTTDTRIVMFDEPWGPALRERLVKIREIDESYLDLLKDTQVFLEHPYPLLSPVIDGNGIDSIFGVPFYVNFSHLCYRKDLIKHYYSSSPIAKRYFNSDGELVEELTWEAISQICGNLVNLEKNSEPQNRIFKDPRKSLEFYFDSDEPSMASFFLELIWPIIFKEPSNSDLRIKNLPSLASDMVKWLKIAQNWVNRLREVDIKDEFDFVFGRLWRAVSAFIERDRSIEFGYCSIPPLRDHQQPGTCMSGNWYLGVSKGSANPYRALKTIKQMTDESTNNDIFHTKAALPTHRFYWNEESVNAEFVPKGIIELYKEARSRCQIVNFHRIPAVLESGFDKLLNLKSASAEIVKGILEVMQSEIDYLTRDT